MIAEIATSKSLRRKALAAANARAVLALSDRRGALAELDRIFADGQTSVAELEVVRDMLDPTSFEFRLAEDCVGSWRVQPGSTMILEILHWRLQQPEIQTV